MTIEEYMAIESVLGFDGAERALEAAGGFSTSASENNAPPQVTGDLRLNPMLSAVGGSNWGTNVPTTAIPIPGSANTAPPPAATPVPTPVPVPAATANYEPAEGTVQGDLVFRNGQWSVNTVSTPTPTQADQWATQYGQPGSPRVITELNKLSDSELQNLANNPEFQRLYPQAAQILTTRTTAATAATALTKEQSTWSTNYGAAGTQRAMDFVLNMDAGEFSRMTKDFKDYYATEYAARVIAEKNNPNPAVAKSSGDVVLELINAGNVVKASQLTEITDPGARTAAATRLAKNIVKTNGSTQDSVNELSNIYNQYIDYQGAEAINFSDWATNTGMDFTKLPIVTASDTPSGTASDVEVAASVQDYFPESATNPTVIDALNDSAAMAGNETNVTFTVADIAQDLASGALTIEDAIKAYRSLNTTDGNNRAAALETGTSTGTGIDTGTGLPIGTVREQGTEQYPLTVAGTAQDRLNRIFQQSSTRGGRRDLFDAFSATQGGTPLQRSARNLSFDPLSAAFTINQANDPSFNTLTDPEGVIRANPNSFRDFLASGEGGGMPQRLGTSSIRDAFKEFGSLYGNNNLNELDEARRGFISNAGQNLATEYLSSQVNPMFRSNIAGAVGRRFNASRDADPLGDQFGGFLGRYGF